MINSIDDFGVDVECEHQFVMDVRKVAPSDRGGVCVGTVCVLCDQKRDMHGEKIRDVREPLCYEVGHDVHDDRFCKRCGISVGR